MPVTESIAAEQAEIIEWRRFLHRCPELLYDTVETAAFVAEKLREFGCDEVVTGIGTLGVVGVVHGRVGNSGPMLGLRSDMDALPIAEATGLPYASLNPGKMHACGHDGHMAMLLGAARHLARNREFNGSVAFIFQPAEEGGAGAKAMIDDGLFDRFNIERVFGMHNLPGLPIGNFAMCPGPIMAATDEFAFEITGRSGHAAIPHRAADPVLAGAALVLALQQIVARNTDPLDALVVSATEFHSGFVHNVIPDKATISGTVRSLKPQTRLYVEERMNSIAQGIGLTHGVQVDLTYHHNYPVTQNDPEQTDLAAQAAMAVSGASAVSVKAAPLMAGEDFSFMLQKKPGAFIFIGNGDTAGLHNSTYNFSDDAIIYGSSYWVTLVNQLLTSK
ncbi:amidohydrolase [Aureimonas fodinaquatilis]|uniref:Amidohydrolase n=1 Tax=Aureimonas fodinaquatilis TaxID=2565783 RepID=A0A5B0DYK9_9HYPH|nr:M20 aminoacylase family protein [Aureimonas fodinaquatilis]KAA0971566.1 amidohydrolase [Aureimonas fodinaquatilis]